MNLTKAHFLSWVKVHYGDEYRRDCEKLLRKEGGDSVADPEALLSQVIGLHQPEMKYDGRKFAAARTSSH